MGFRQIPVTDLGNGHGSPRATAVGERVSAPNNVAKMTLCDPPRHLDGQRAVTTDYDASASTFVVAVLKHEGFETGWQHTDAEAT